MTQYILKTVNKRGDVTIHIPSTEWLLANNYNYKKLAELLKLKKYEIINKKTLEQKNDC